MLAMQVDGNTQAGAVFWIPDVTEWKKGDTMTMITSPTPMRNGYFGGNDIQVVGDTGVLFGDPSVTVHSPSLATASCLGYARVLSSPWESARGAIFVHLMRHGWCRWMAS